MTLDHDIDLDLDLDHDLDADLEVGAAAGPDDATEDPDGRDAARTTGLLCWRPARERKQGMLDVLVRRSSPEDPGGWALPRAVPDQGESRPQAAMRALTDARAAGVRLVPRLGIPLDVAGPVTYWAARLRERENSRPETDGLVEELTWMPGAGFEDVLADAADREAVATALAAAGHGHLDTRPLVIVRHAKARPRSRWSHADADRPLVDLGRQQAVALAGLLECWHPEYLLASPWTRCTDTLVPYVKSNGLRLRTRGSLSEKAHRAAPQKAARHLRAAIAKGEAALVCTHRPVLPTVLKQLALRATTEAREALPTDDPFLSPSEVLVAHVASRVKAGTPCVVAVELHRPVL